MTWTLRIPWSLILNSPQPNDQTSEYAKVFAETYFAQSTETSVYVDMVQNALEQTGHDRLSNGRFLKILTSLFKLVTGVWMLVSIPGATATAPAMMCLTEHEEMKTQGSTSWESIFIVLAILALLRAGIYLWRLQAAQRRLVLEIDDLHGQLMQSNHRANALAVVYGELRSRLRQKDRWLRSSASSFR